ncbi:MAG: hypothetical protein AABW81_04355, partial [Nanoarchaeota archaeon]
MSYKRYIKRDGKVYGPYTYQSKKDNGKVISTYLGKDDSSVTEKNNSKKFIILGIASLVILLGILFILFYQSNLTGHVTMQINDNYKLGEQIKGSVNLNIKHGELLPSDTKVIVENAGEQREFFLSELVSSEVSSGNFYVENINISGLGNGYGVEGEKTIYPDVAFTLKIMGKKNDVKDLEENTEEITNQIEQTETTEEQNEESTNNEQQTTDNSETPASEIQEQTPITETSSLEQTQTTETSSQESTTSSESSSDTSSSSSVSESFSTSSESSSSGSDSTVSSSGGESSSGGDSGASSGESSGGITGEVSLGFKQEEKSVIADFFRKTFGKLTGKVIDEVDSKDKEIKSAESESSREISGVVSKDKPYTYNINLGESAEITNSEHDVSIKTQGDLVTVTTDYSETEKGFGEEFLNDETEKINIDISKLNLSAQDGVLTVKLVYGNNEIISLNQEISVDLEEQNITILNETLINKTKIILNETLTNITLIDLIGDNLTINTTQYGAVINKPVKWKKKITSESPVNLTLEIHKEATNITVFKISGEEKQEINETASSQLQNIINQTESINPLNETSSESSNIVVNNESFFNNSITGEIISNNKVEDIKEDKNKKKTQITAKVITGKVSAEINIDNDEGSVIASFFRNIFRRMTGRVIDVQETSEIKEVLISENATEFEIEYETPAPLSEETNTSNGKEIVISSEVHYENVLAYTDLPREFETSDSIKLYHLTNETIPVLTVFDAYDTNNNSLIDYIEWIVPSMSNQTYQLIIEISKAEHLDSNKTFISDIYNDVKALDGNWSETIKDGEYVRVTFEIPLDKTRDITIYPRITSGTPKIEIYEFDNNTLIAEFTSLINNQYNKIYLTNLPENYTQDVFDLKIINGSVEFDYIVDPATSYNLSFVSPTPANNAFISTNYTTINI